MGCRFAPLLQKNATLEDPSRVIVTASIAGMGVGSLGENATFGYSASKGILPLSPSPPPFSSHPHQLQPHLTNPLPHTAAAIHLTRNLAVELGPRHILCNSISPGFFPSKMASGLMDLQGGAEQMAKLNPNGRLGRPEDIAAVCFGFCFVCGF